MLHRDNPHLMLNAHQNPHLLVMTIQIGNFFLVAARFPPFFFFRGHEAQLPPGPQSFNTLFILNHPLSVTLFIVDNMVEKLCFCEHSLAGGFD